MIYSQPFQRSANVYFSTHPLVSQKNRKTDGWKHFFATTVGTEDIESTSDEETDTHTYNLRGQRVGANAKGLIIRNGKKVIVN